MIRMLAALMLLPNVLLADPWKVFETRCLIPLENLGPLVTADFKLERDRPEFSLHLWQSHDVIVQVTTYKTTTQRQSCLVNLLDGSQWPDTLAKFTMWRNAAIADERYVIPNRDVADGSPAGGNALYSNEVREPRLRVGYITPDDIGGPAMFAEDTDLES